MSLIGSRVAYVNIADDVGGHGGPPLTVCRKTPRRKLPNLEEGASNGGLWVISAREIGAGSTMTLFVAILAAGEVE
jgi:hypothetical protein